MRAAKLSVWLSVLLAGLWCADVSAEYTTGRYTLSGSVSEQSTFQRKDSFTKVDYVQQRSEVVLGGVWRAIEDHDNAPLLLRWDWSLQWRGRYDAIFQIRDRYRKAGYDRDDFMWPEGDKPREFYTDLVFRDLPISLRIGKQQVVWGEADFFRSIDVINPLRLDQMTLVGDDLDKYREPLWIAKVLYTIGDFKYVAGLNAEAFYSPDGRPLTDKIILGGGWRIFDDYDNCFPQPISCQRPHQNNWRRTRHPWEIERVGPEDSTAPDQGDLGPLLQSLGIPSSTTNGKADFIYLGNQKFGDKHAFGGYKEVSFDRSMFGIRFQGQETYANVFFTLNYLYKRAEIPAPSLGWKTLFDPALADDGGLNLRTDIAARAVTALASPDLNGDGVPDGNDALLKDCLQNSTPQLILGASATQGRSPYGYKFPNESLGAACLPVYLQHPWTHIIGGTATYNDFNYTGFIFRLEESISLKEPRTKYPALLGPRAGTFPTDNDFGSGGGKETTQIWRSMIGFDYLAAPFRADQIPRWMYNIQVLRSLTTDQWFYTFQFFNEYWSNVSDQLGQGFEPYNRHLHFNPILTWIQTGFFMQSRLRPTIAIGYDTNSQFPVSWFQIQWFFSQKLMLRVGDVSYWGSRHADSFLFLNKYADRDTMYLRLTYFFL